MKKLILIVFTVITVSASAQQPVRRLPSLINHPSLNLYAPYISADGNALLFVSNSGQDGALVISYTSRESDWVAPVELPKQLNNRLNFTPGYALSADGKRIYLTSAKSPVIGGYDIFTAELKGTTWTNPENLMLPINSKTNDACPSFTTDGNTIYFMRCDKMDVSKADGCKIFKSSKKANGQWEEPIELSANINTGNSQTPRIMGDKQTLIFSSNKMGGKGGMDLFVSKNMNGNWSDPVPLDFVNTEKDDQYVSVNALGRYLLKEAKGSRNNSELTEFLIPTHLRPKGLMKIEGKISGNDGVIPSSYISLVDLKTKSGIYSGRPQKDGSFFLYIPEGSVYELSLDPEQSDVSYFVKTFDLTSEKIPQIERVNAVLKKPIAGDEFVFEQVKFKPYSSELEDSSVDELKKFARLASANPGLRFEIQVLLKGYREDFQQSDPDLTESMQENTEEIQKIEVDSVYTQDVDSASSVMQTEIQRVRYHNDRTKLQAITITDFLVAKGVNPGQLSVFVNAIPSSDGTSSLNIKARTTN
jgi:hypothetical protein